MTYGRPFFHLCIPATLVLGLCSFFSAAATTIVVDAGPFPSVEAAATGEESVDWSDPASDAARACTECYAAVELQHYLRKMTGTADDFAVADAAALPDGAVIVVGMPREGAPTAPLAETLGVSPTNLTQLGPEGYRIRKAAVNGRDVLLIAGGGRIGTMYGVYDFLHRQGCRWFAPGEVHEEIPSADYGAIGVMDVTETPDFAMRGFHAWEDRGNPEFVTWMGRNRMNYWCVQDQQHALLHKLGIQLVWGGHVIGYEYLRPGDPYPYNHAKFDKDDDLRDDPYPVGNSYAGDENGDGKLSYVEAHPEWYGMNAEGERVKTLRNSDYNYCTSNPHATAELMKNAVQELIDGDAKDATIVNCWSVDGGKWCHCDACKAVGTPTDRNLRFVHAFDQEVKRAQAAGLIKRPITLLFLAYYDVLEPPTKPLPEDFDYETCIATYFPIVRSYVFNIDDPESEVNKRYAEHLEGWAVDPERYYKGQICIGEYYNVSGYKCLPICFMHTMENDIPWYYEQMNARNFHYMHVTTRNWGNKALTNYQMARQLWAHDADCEALWDDYFGKRYGSAAGDMREFYLSLETMLCNASELKYRLAPRLSRGVEDLFPNPTLRYKPNPDEEGSGPSMLEIIAAADRCRAIIDKVLEGDLPDRIRGRVKEDEYMFTYGERTVRFYDALARAYFAARDHRREDAREAFQEAQDLANLLEQETEACQNSSSHANASNGLEASRAGGALATLTSILGPLDENQIVKLDFSAGTQEFTGHNFIGGGASRFGYHLNAYPGRIPLTDDGNFVYAAPTGEMARMTAYFELAEPPKGDVEAVMIGLNCAEPRGGDIPGQVVVNDTVVFDGNTPFAEDKLSESAPFTIPAGAFKQGLNKLTVKNVAKEGHVGDRPWFGIHKVRMTIK